MFIVSFKSLNAKAFGIIATTQLNEKVIQHQYYCLWRETVIKNYKLKERVEKYKL